MLASRLHHIHRLCPPVRAAACSCSVRSLGTFAGRYSIETPSMNKQDSTDVAISVNQDGARLAPFIIGVAGGTASGKTSVCRKIMQQLRKDVPVRRTPLSILQLEAQAHRLALHSALLDPLSVALVICAGSATLEMILSLNCRSAGRARCDHQLVPGQLLQKLDYPRNSRHCQFQL